MLYLLAILFSAVISVGLTLGVRRLALAFNIVDSPSTDPSRKIHRRPIPLLGGVGVIGTFLLGILGVLVFFPDLLSGSISGSLLIGISIGSLFILIGGALDDRYNLPPLLQLVFPFLASLSVIVSGLDLSFITNPFGGIFSLSGWEFSVWGQAYSGVSILFLLAWIFSVSYTTKILDGLDGLVSGIAVISGIILMFLSLAIGLSDVALLSAIFSGAYLGFLVFNFHPASIFLGESGALFAGFLLSILAVMGSGKVATAFLVLGIPILDMVWTLFRRMVIERKSPFKGDRKHLHFLLLDRGLSQRQAVLTLYLFSGIFGLVALFLQSMGKLVAIIVLIILMILLLELLYFRKGNVDGNGIKS
ncbi:MAG: UDP-N-acetylglucosamine:undecaprenyl-P N-acetylglucosaminyl 1-P transferase [Parcubacteria group bacterium Gr01-1014_18]|nr:MAG: UDP-N-acetylglucosamine:undecaprenyl-P N-acetylglucosaminyl 1-P transferase [Parcubacteria group bacterium Greene0416_36]TSC81118.1 MAG: UDP-N-acetylglucosamine:undecaprenyl-P N-acetylglucosaminyl 1-P transferase [Parcubacteria group bacterium Gr01-1014_18]TSD07369.1 MAG: UDP-N-acetylglucosamine:undecaprenyl-P N-acetylglucosaminyl 1-P transferase [Parcubacteria group bacterium Greene0714_2]